MMAAKMVFVRFSFFFGGGQSTKPPDYLPTHRTKLRTSGDIVE